MNNTTAKHEEMCYQPGLQGKPTKELFRNVFLPLLALSIFGNIANIIVYRHPYLKSSTTVRMLSFKAIANMLSVVCMVPSFTYFYLYTSQDNGLQSPFLKNELIPWFYWHTLKYAMFGSNWFSTVAVWLTVAVTLEHYMLVGFPMKAKAWSTMRNAHVIVCGCTMLSALLHSLNLMAFETLTLPCSGSTGNNSNFTSAAGSNFQTYLFIPKTTLPNLSACLQAYFWVHSVTVQVVPMVLLVSLSWLIYNKLFRGRKFSRSTTSEPRLTVVRLALATTTCHIIFEMPHVVVMVLAAIFGGHQGAWPKQAEINAAAMFLGFTNASVTFIVYLGCSRKFRQIACVTCCGRTCVFRVLSEAELNSLKRSRNRKETLGGGTFITTNDRRSSYTVADSLIVRPVIEETMELISMTRKGSTNRPSENDVQL